MAKIPATVVTGFLGAGKTTLIRNLLAAAGGRRIALVINEFGDIGIDGEILKSCGDADCDGSEVGGGIVELSNGCICCTVADDFVPAIETLIGRAPPPDHIVIETSGLALPQPLIRAFNWPEIRTRITVDGVVTVVDGPAMAAGRFSADDEALAAQREADDGLDHETPLADLFEDQLACADMIVLSKADLLDGRTTAKIMDDLGARVRPGVQFLRSTAEGIGADALLGLDAGAEADLENRHEIHHRHDDDDAPHDHAHGHEEFESFHIDLGEISDSQAFLDRLGETIAAHGLLRIKGFAAISGKPMRQVVQAVGPRIDAWFDRPFGTDARETRLVVIGFHGLDRTAIAAALGA